MATNKKIVIDAFGADGGEEIIISGTFKALEDHPELGAVIVGSKKSFQNCLTNCNIDKSRVEFIEADDFISHNDPPTCVFRGRDTSSLVLALKNLKEREDCFAALSPGNTGALFVGSMCHLGLKSGMKAPVLSAALPTPSDNWVCLLDCGASLSCTAGDLEKFARLGDEFARLALGKEHPRIGLLNVGTEDNKGSDLIKSAYTLLKESELNFIGNVESYDLFSDKIDVVVTDGFTGNILLKTVEATGAAAREIVEMVSRESGAEKEPLANAILERLSRKFDLNIYGGATFLGTVKPIVKMHGCSTETTVKSCIEQLIRVENALSYK